MRTWPVGTWQALVRMALSSSTDAMAIAFFVRSVQEASARAAREWVHVLDSVVFGAAPNPPALMHSASLPILGPSDSRATPEEHLLGEHSTPDGAKGQRASSASHLSSSLAATEAGPDMHRPHKPEKSGEASALQHSRSFSASPGGGMAADAEGLHGASKSSKPPLTSHGAAGEAGSASSSRGEEDDLMSMCARQPCRWTALQEAHERRGVLIKARKFVRVLRELGNKLVDINPALRQQELQLALERVNDKIPSCLYIPFLQRQYALFHVLSILPGEARVFNTNKRCPFLIVAEIEVKAWQQADAAAAASSKARVDDAGAHAGGRCLMPVRAGACVAEPNTRGRAQHTLLLVVLF